jgi:hypothetical protein
MPKNCKDCEEQNVFGSRRYICARCRTKSERVDSEREVNEEYRPLEYDIDFQKLMR